MTESRQYYEIKKIKKNIKILLPVLISVGKELIRGETQVSQINCLFDQISAYRISSSPLGELIL